jgi:LytS/YehU family sensor histidine kinase
MMDYDWKQITILRKNMTDPVVMSVALGYRNHTTISMILCGSLPARLCISSSEADIHLEYKKNPQRFYKWLIPGGFFIFVFLLTWLIRKTQRTQIEKRVKTEKKITELQLKIVRNQMDPHFTMNAVNAVIDSINREEKEDARDNLLHFSKMYRSLVLSADKIKRSLREEIEFTENYLALEQFRFRDRFRYVIEIQPDVDINAEVPKMVIQSSVENAVKHGMQHRGSPGEVRITIGKEDKILVITVTDNGIGREATAVFGTAGTGKGMEMMNQFFDLYHRITGVKIETKITDLPDETNHPDGTMVIIQIQLF